eukprot:5875819-Pyramimonas_sp.AAC.1
MVTLGGLEHVGTSGRGYAAIPTCMWGSRPPHLPRTIATVTPGGPAVILLMRKFWRTLAAT